MELFGRNIGLFKGFVESGLEYNAEIVSPYHTEYRPTLGDFILVELNKMQAVLGRITKFYPVGIMSSIQGQDYLASISRINEEVPEDLKENKLRYSVNISLLGTLTDENHKFSFTPSVRRLPHLGARVTSLSEEMLSFVCALGSEAVDTSTGIGYLALGDSVYDGKSGVPALPVTFNLSHLIARRSFIFARAGYGKSNLIKLLTAKLYERTQPGGMLIFDPEGEYAFTDKNGRPGLCDIEGMADNVVVFTDRNASGQYGRWVQGRVKLNLCELTPSEVVNLCVVVEKQEANFANMVRGLSDNNWRRLVNLLAEKGYHAPDEEIKDIVGAISDAELVSRNAIKNNLTPVVRTLHEPGSRMLDAVRYHLSRGRVVILDISLKSSAVGNRIMGLVLNELFRQNQENFTIGSEGEVIKIIAVIEEAQSVLPRQLSDTSPFVAWVKEGRKYDLGCILITQQPGSIASELLSQGDNFFAFHLLSANDLRALQASNAHFSNDILASILNEPIKGNAYYWSAPDQPFVMSAKIESFEEYANEKRADLATTTQTPTEEYEKIYASVDKIIADAVINAIEQAPKVCIRDVKSINGRPTEKFFAIKCLNLQFNMAESLEVDNIAQYCDRFKDGKLTLKSEYIERALRKNELVENKAILYGTDSGGKRVEYYVLRKNRLKLNGKTIKEAIELVSK